MHMGGDMGQTYWMRAGSEIPPGWASDGLFDMLDIRPRNQKTPARASVRSARAMRKEFGRTGDESVGGRREGRLAVTAPATARRSYRGSSGRIYLPAMLQDCRSGGDAEEAEELFEGV